MHIRRSCIALSILLATTGLIADDSRPKIGLALSGGGARGYAHVGVLKVLEEMHVPIDYIAGTSMGAVVGALYASGMSPEEIEREFAGDDWGETQNDATPYRSLSHRRKQEVSRYPSTTEFGFKGKRLTTATGFRTGQRMTVFLARVLIPHLDEPAFAKFPIPFAAVAADLATGEAVVLSRGDIAASVRASMSIPGVLTPVEMNGRLLVDGGIAANVPVDVVRAMGADIVIAVDVGQLLYDKEQLQSTLAIVDQLSTLLTRSNMEPQLANADLVIAPDLVGISSFAFEDSATIIALGVVDPAARSALETFAIDPEAHARMIAGHRVPREREIVIDEIRIEGNHFVDAGFLIDRLEGSLGKPLDLEALDRDIEWLYGSGDFIGIHFGLETMGDRTTLVIRVQEKPWGPNFLRAGLTLSANTVQNVEVDLLFNFTKRWINDRGGEWRTDLRLGGDPYLQTEYYQPHDFDRPGFIRVGAGASQERIDLYEGNDVVSVYELERVYAYADAGVVFSSLGEASIGLLYRWTDAGVTIGPPALLRVTAQEGALTAGLVFDSRDNPFIPLSGSVTRLNVIAPLEALNAEQDYAWTTFESRVHLTRNRHTWSAGVRLTDALGGEPVSDFASLGGFQNLSGYAPNQLVGSAASLVQLGYYFEAKGFLPILGKGFYLGGLLEAGNTASSLDETIDDLLVSVTAYIAVSTNFGPAFVGVAKAEDADWQYYVTIGRSF